MSKIATLFLVLSLFVLIPNRVMVQDIAIWNWQRVEHFY